MTDRQAMQMALDALNLPSMKTMQMLQQRDEAIATLRAALEQHEQEPVETYGHEYCSQPHPNDFGIPKGHWWKAKQYADALYTTSPQQQAEPVALIRDGVLRWHIPHEHYARPGWTAHGTHMLYTTPLQRQPLTDEQRIEVLRTTKFRDWFIAGSRGAASRAAEVAHDIKEKP